MCQLVSMLPPPPFYLIFLVPMFFNYWVKDMVSAAIQTSPKVVTDTNIIGMNVVYL